MPKVVNRAEKQQAILDTAVDVIYEQGIEAVSIRQIARASGMGRSSIYTYFNNREDILHVALRQVLAAFEKLQSDLLAQTWSVTDKISGFFRGSFYPDEKLNRYVVVVTEYLAYLRRHRRQADALVSDFTLRLKALFESLLKQGISQGEFIPHDTEKMAVILSALNEHQILHKISTANNTAPFDHTSVRLILQGILKRM